MDSDRAQQLMGLIRRFWLEPELHRRYPSGFAPPGFELRAAQIIFPGDGSDPTVRLNEEVRAVATAKALRAIEANEPVTFDDAEIIDVMLTDEDPDAAHFTAVATGGGWLVSYDLRLNATRMAQHSTAAKEFLDSARDALHRANLRAFVQNLLDAAELMAKALLLKGPDVRILTTKTHRQVKSSFNQQTTTGGVDTRFADLLNRLSDLRAPARYLTGELQLERAEAETMLAVAEDMLTAVGEATPPRYPLSAASPDDRSP